MANDVGCHFSCFFADNGGFGRFTRIVCDFGENGLMDKSVGFGFYCLLYQLIILLYTQFAVISQAVQIRFVFFLRVVVKHIPEEVGNVCARAAVGDILIDSREKQSGIGFHHKARRGQEDVQIIIITGRR